MISFKEYIIETKQFDSGDQVRGLSSHGRHEYDIEHYKDGKITHKTKIISHHPPSWISKIAKHIDKKPGMSYKIVHDESGKVYHVKEEIEQ